MTLTPQPPNHPPIQFFVTTSFKISHKTKFKKQDPHIFVQPFKNGKTKELVTKNNNGQYNGQYNGLLNERISFITDPSNYTASQ